LNTKLDAVETKKSRKNPNSKRYNKNLRVCCSAEEATIIKQNASKLGVSVSSYLCNLGIGNNLDVPINTDTFKPIEEIENEDDGEREEITRKTCTPIAVYVLPQEKELIIQNAKQHGRTTSNFLRVLGKGFLPKSTIDATCIEELGRINADQARLGNLLKMWLAQEDERRFNAVGENTVKALVDQIKQTQIKLNTQIEVLGDIDY